MSHDDPDLLEVCGIHKSFGAQKVLDQVSLRIRKGEIFGIIGPNGSGKSTLFNIIAGAMQADTGHMYFDAIPINGLSARLRSRIGIARTFQSHRLFAGMTACENVAAAMTGSGAGYADAIGRARSLLARFFPELQAEREVSGLCLLASKKLEIARCLGTSPRLLLLDEIMSGLRPAEISEMTGLLLRLNRGGLTIALIDHVLPAVKSMCTRLALLHHGRFILEDTPEKVLSHPLTVRCYLGEQMNADTGEEAQERAC